MKSLSSFLFFFPIILFITVLLLNLGLLTELQSFKIPFLFQGETQVFLWFSLFFVLYILGLWGIFKFSNFFSSVQKGKLGTQVNDLKAELHDKQGELINTIKKDFEVTLTSFKTESEKDRKVYKTETDKILNNLQFEITQLSEKISELTTKK